MTFSGKTPNKADLARRALIHAGHCMACVQLDPPVDMRGQGFVQWHHTKGKKRHDLTCGLCCWHHMGQPFFAATHAEMRADYGPALSEGSRPFHARFGSNEELLARQQTYLTGDAS